MQPYPFGMKFFSPFREGKMLLLVQDIIFIKHNLVNTNNESKALRRYILRFLAAAYKHYDIILWSSIDNGVFIQRMLNFGILNNRDFNILMTVDLDSSLTGLVPNKGLLLKKLIEDIWNDSNNYNPSNTVMVVSNEEDLFDDYPNAVTIEPFQKACRIDVKLPFLEKYIKQLAEINTDVRTVNCYPWLINSIRLELQIKYHRDPQISLLISLCRSIESDQTPKNIMKIILEAIRRQQI